MLNKSINFAGFVIIIFSVLPFFAYSEQPNLVKNPGFESVDKIGTPEEKVADWSIDAFKSSAADLEYKIEQGKGRNNSNCYTLISKTPNDSRFVQKITVEPGKIYHVSVWLKIGKLESAENGGANISFPNAVFFSPNVYDTKGDWQQVEFNLKTVENGERELIFWLRLGGFGSTCSGIVSFDDISVTLVEDPSKITTTIEKAFNPKDNAPADKTAQNNQPANNDSQQGASTGNNSILIYIIIGVVIVALLAVIEIILRKRQGQKKADPDQTAATEQPPEEKKE
jgi:hypothetical protein